MSNVIDLEKYRRKKILENKNELPQDITNEELFSIIMGVMTSEPLDKSFFEEEAEEQAKRDFEKYKDDEGVSKCLFCGSVISEKDDSCDED